MTTDQQKLTVPATKLRRDLGAVLDAVLTGQTVHIERNGRPLAVLMPADEYERLANGDVQTPLGDIAKRPNGRNEFSPSGG